MLPRRFRLTAARDFQFIYKTGRRRASHYFLLRLSRGPSQATRIAVVVSTKVSKRAVVRNRLKRHVRAVVGQLLPTLPTGLDIIITVRQVVSDSQAWPAFREELRNLLAPPFFG